MLERLVTKKDLKSSEKVKTLPIQVTKAIEQTLEILDKNYGEERPINEGGYALIITTVEDLRKAGMKDKINFDTGIFEYVDLISLKYSYNWIEALIIKGNDYGVVVYMPIALMTKNLKRYLEGDK